MTYFLFKLERQVYVLGIEAMLFNFQSNKDHIWFLWNGMPDLELAFVDDVELFSVTDQLDINSIFSRIIWNELQFPPIVPNQNSTWLPENTILTIYFNYSRQTTSSLMTT
jgi:hypothetical protein